MKRMIKNENNDEGVRIKDERMIRGVIKDERMMKGKE
jgi:hypothetical protein